MRARVGRHFGAVNNGKGHETVMSDHRSVSTSFQGQTGCLDLHAIVYVSTAARPVSLVELMRLLDGARRRNADEGITGVLLYSDTSFMQYLEGPAAGLSRVYDIIKHHPLHHGLIDLVREPIQEREFADWAMAFHMVGAFGRASPANQDALLADRLRIGSRPPSAACGLLSEFWFKGRGAVSSALGSSSQVRAPRLSGGLDTGTHD
jgi:hypothetical protein